MPASWPASSVPASPSPTCASPRKSARKHRICLPRVSALVRYACLTYAPLRSPRISGCGMAPQHERCRAATANLRGSYPRHVSETRVVHSEEASKGRLVLARFLKLLVVGLIKSLISGRGVRSACTTRVSDTRAGRSSRKSLATRASPSISRAIAFPPGPVGRRRVAQAGSQTPLPTRPRIPAEAPCIAFVKRCAALAEGTHTERVNRPRGRDGERSQEGKRTEEHR